MEDNRMEEMNHYRNILLAVSGLTPQIITETLYGLVVEKRNKIDEIVIITTTVGEEILKKYFLKADGPLYRFFGEYNIMPHEIQTKIILIRNNRGEALEDIRTREDNEDMAKTVMQTVYELTFNEKTRVFASIAGGRKTMSAYLALAMQLFAREQDQLMHVLVWPPEIESDRNFFYPPKETKTIVTSKGQEVPVKDIRVELARIPIIRLRNAIQELSCDIQNYFDLISLSQFKIDEIQQEIQAIWDVQNESLSVWFGERSYPPVRIPGKLAAVYHGICQFGSVILEDDKFIDEVKKIYDKFYKKRDFEVKGYGQTWEITQIQKDISTIRDKIKKSLPGPLAKLFWIESQRSYADPTRYFIPHLPTIK